MSTNITTRTIGDHVIEIEPVGNTGFRIWGQDAERFHASLSDFAGADAPPSPMNEGSFIVRQQTFAEYALGNLPTGEAYELVKSLTDPMQLDSTTRSNGRY